MPHDETLTRCLSRSKKSTVGMNDAASERSPTRLLAIAFLGSRGIRRRAERSRHRLLHRRLGAAKPEQYVKAALSVTPRRYERHVERALHETAHNLTRWLWGRILAMAFVGTTACRDQGVKAITGATNPKRAPVPGHTCFRPSDGDLARGSHASGLRQHSRRVPLLRDARSIRGHRERGTASEGIVQFVTFEDEHGLLEVDAAQPFHLRARPYR